MFKNFFSVIILIAVILVGCKESTADKTFTQKLEYAHNKADFQKHNAVSFDIALYFNGVERMQGTMILATNSSASRINLKDSSAIFVKNDKIFFSPNLKDTSSVRFNPPCRFFFFKC